MLNKRMELNTVKYYVLQFNTVYSTTNVTLFSIIGVKLVAHPLTSWDFLGIHFLLCPNILKILFKSLMFKTLFKDQDLFQPRQDILCGNVYSWLTHMASVDLADAENTDGAAQHI